MTPLFVRPRPLKTAWRFTVSSAGFFLPCHGVWARTLIGGGGGGGATHSSYATPSERGENGSIGNIGSSYLRSVARGITVGAGGLGGTLTNSSDVSAQRGKVGGDTDNGEDIRSGGAGGRCAFEATGLNPAAPSGSYPAAAYNSSSVASGALLGVFQYGGSPSTAAGQGASGNASPPPALAGNNGSSGRVDWYLQG